MNLSVVTRNYVPQLLLFFLSNQVLQHCSFRNLCYWFSIFEVHFEPFEKNDCHIPAGIDDFVIVTTFILLIFNFIKNGQKVINNFVCKFLVFNITMWCLSWVLEIYEAGHAWYLPPNSSQISRCIWCGHKVLPCVESLPRLRKESLPRLRKDAPVGHSSNPDFCVARLLCRWQSSFIVWTILMFIEHCQYALRTFACMM